MKRVLFIVTCAVLIVSGTYAQDCTIYSAYEEGNSYKMVHYDKKDKPTGFTVSTVKQRNTIPGGVAMIFNQQYDNYDEYTFESEFEVRCVNGDVIVDMRKFIDPNSMAAYQDMEIEVQADDFTLPKNAGPGDKLDDGSVTVTVDTGTPVRVTLTVTMSNRQVVSKENVETPAGSFDCLKISYDILTQVGFMKIQASAVEYFNEEHGVIRSESFNKKGKLTGYSVVEEIIN